MVAGTELTPIERALLELIGRAGGRGIGWHELAVELSARDLPRAPDLMTVLLGLERRGLAYGRELGDGNDRWRLTPAGASAVGVEAPAAGPLPAEELESFAAALSGTFSDFQKATWPFVEDAAGLEVLLTQVLAEASWAGEGVAFAALTLPAERRAAWIERLAGHERLDVRRALFQAMAPDRLEVQGTRRPLLPDGEAWTALLRRALASRDEVLRAAAASLTFATACGDALADALLGAYEASERTTQWRVLLALGSAKDEGSLELLRHVSQGKDDLLAGAAVRALAARKETGDG